ncbi:DUF2975 domain-containing protein [Mobilitalea sibirica]|uniref:DUF2975 domain-containing protein n=1 Tax=Mobilitalea sibirica TaxID=1462919 RepID=A0A8J7L3G4_9FIRM|nr:DUF2975 domain-containing protein [Mobilitalea sibirica]MBH1942563.1 DUF2975 domain-containing protein [Mobilitalea sibirica]
MKHGSTLFLKLALILIGIPVLALCVIGISRLINNPINPDYASILYPIIAGMYASTIPFYIALYKAFKLLNYIDNNTAFSDRSVVSLKHIKCCAIVFSALYVLMMPFLYLLAQKDDAPGLIIMGMVPVFASMVIAVFAAVLQKLLREAINLKSENDLTI